MSNIAIFPPNKAQLDAMPLVASVQYFEPRPASAINRMMNGLFPNALLNAFTVVPKASGLVVTVLAAGGLALVKTETGESIKVEGQHNVDRIVSVGANYLYLVANFKHNTITNQVDTSSAINPADIIVSSKALKTGQLLAIVTVPAAAVKVTTAMISYKGVERFSFKDFARQDKFAAHNHDGRYLLINDQAKSAITSDKLGGQLPAHYAKASQVLTNVPANAVFTDTQRALSDSIASNSSTVAATSKAAKAAYDKGAQALATANTKLNANAKAVDSDKLDGKDSLYFARADQVLTDVPKGAVFTDTQRPISNSVASTSATTSASGVAVKTAYDKGVEALAKANTKLDATAKAVDSDKLDGKDSLYFARADQVLTNVPKGAKFTDTNTHRAIHDGLTSKSAVISLSANQGYILKGMIDNLTAIVSSDDTTLNEIQEIVNFIKQNKNMLDSLVIANIAGLQAALDLKLNANAKAVDSDKLDGHDSLYFAKASQVLTDVPKGAKFTDTNTQRAISDSVSTVNASVSASQTAVKTAYDKGVEALAKANTKLGATSAAVDSAKLGGQLPAHYAKASQVLTDVPAGAKFTDTNTQRPLSNSVASTSQTDAATALAAKTAYDRGTEALNVANTKLGATAKAVDSAKLEGQAGSFYAKASQVLTNVPAGAKFTDTNTHRAISDSVATVSNSTSASLTAVKTAHDKGVAAYNLAATKLSASGKAVDSAKLENKPASSFVQTSGNQVITGKKTFDTEIGLGTKSGIKYDAATESIMFVFD